MFAHRRIRDTEARYQHRPVAHLSKDMPRSPPTTRRSNEHGLAAETHCLTRGKVDATYTNGQNACTRTMQENALSSSVHAAKRFARLLLAGIFVALLAGCGAAPPKPTIIDAVISVSPGLNPDSRGRASPIVVRIFELKTLAAFNGADFFSLWDRERETLAAELVARDELQLRPGEQTKFERTLQPDTRHVAVIAAFRDLERAQWRGAISVVPNQKQPIIIKLEARSVTISGK
jgi:type VI secretion system protein VasD